jgi:hypothetical protein|tara:strand:- start:1576 stop:1800 length:225 start_codon:yes stop_codon:yes gene_type:complete
MKTWNKIKLWFDPDQKLTVTHMGVEKVFFVDEFSSKKPTRLAGKTVDGRKFLLVSETPMEFEIIEIPTSDKIYN